MLIRACVLRIMVMVCVRTKKILLNDEPLVSFVLNK